MRAPSPSRPGARPPANSRCDYTARVLAKLHRIWPGLAILLGLLGGGSLCAYAGFFGVVNALRFCNSGGCEHARAARDAHYNLLFAIGAIGGCALILVAVIALYRRGWRRLGPAAGPLAEARLRRADDRVIKQ